MHICRVCGVPRDGLDPSLTVFADRMHMVVVDPGSQDSTTAWVCDACLHEWLDRLIPEPGSSDTAEWPLKNDRRKWV